VILLSCMITKNPPKRRRFCKIVGPLGSPVLVYFRNALPMSIDNYMFITLSGTVRWGSWSPDCWQTVRGRERDSELQCVGDRDHRVEIVTTVNRNSYRAVTPVGDSEGGV